MKKVAALAMFVLAWSALAQVDPQVLQDATDKLNAKATTQPSRDEFEKLRKEVSELRQQVARLESENASLKKQIESSKPKSIPIDEFENQLIGASLADLLTNPNLIWYDSVSKSKHSELRKFVYQPAKPHPKPEKPVKGGSGFGQPQYSTNTSGVEFSITIVDGKVTAYHKEPEHSHAPNIP